MASDDLSAKLGPVADDLWNEGFITGKLFEQTQSARRYGNKGSLSLDLVKGTWHDHSGDIIAEDGTPGGGVFDLVCALVPGGRQGAVEWLIEKGHMQDRPKANGAANGSAPAPAGEKFAGFMDHWPIATYEYHDDKGKLAYEVLKFPKDTGGSPYMQRRPHPSGKGWIWGLQAGEYGRIRSGDWFKAKEGKKYEKVEKFGDARRWLYHRKEVLEAIANGKPVILVEGEKDVETLRAWGFTATTNAGGAKFWTNEFYDDLAGGKTIICGDNDDVSRQRTLMHGKELRDRGADVRVLDLARHWQGMPDKADVSDWKDQASGTADAFGKLVDKAPAWKPERPKSLFNAISWSDRHRPRKRLQYLIEDWLTTTGISFIGGRSSSGKSFLTLHAAMCVARGQDFFGKSVRRCGVIYQAGEGGMGLLDRMEAYARHFKVPEDEDVPFELLAGKIDIFSKEKQDVENFINEVKALSMCMSVPAGLIVIDTLKKAAPGIDEISGKDNAVVLANVSRIADETGCHVCLVHHTNADGKKLRGHTSLRDDVDQVILIEYDQETGIRDAVLEKIKDGEDGKKIRFTLIAVPVREELMPDGDAKEITSCAVVTVSEKERLKKEQQRQGYGPNATERRVLVTLFAAANRHGRFVATEKDGPKAAIGRVVVHWDDYRATALEKMPEIENQKQATDKIRKEFERAKDGLLRYGIIGVTKPHLWWDGKPIRGFPNTFPSARPEDQPTFELQPGDDEAFDADGRTVF